MDPLSNLTQQYDVYPYPARSPEDERKRLIEGSPSDLNEIMHYIFDGRWPPGKTLRVLVAGGGTGDATIMLAQQAADANIPISITYVDLSPASRRVAEARAQIRGLSTISFHTGSFLDPFLIGPFDYIDCCGVLHHLPSPREGLLALKDKLAPGGGMGIMVYGAYGRTGVYPLQDALRTLTTGFSTSDKVSFAKGLLKALPSTNWLLKNPFITDHKGSDAGLYDLLLHSQDRSYTVPEFSDLVAQVGLSVVSFIEPARYNPATYVKDSQILQAMRRLSPLEKASLAEIFSGSMTKHIAYVTEKGGQLSPVTLTDIPVLKKVSPKDFARQFKPGTPLHVDIGGVKIPFALPPLSGSIIERVDGRKSWEAIYEDLTADGIHRPWETYWPQIQELYATLTDLNVLLRRKN